MINKILNTKKGRICVIIGVAVIIVFVIVLVLCNNGSGNSDKPSVENNPDEIELNDLEAVDNLQGLMGKEFEGNTDLLDEYLSIETIGAYNGLFVEDGSDEAIENALSIVVKNNGSQTLQIGLITLSDGENEYEFQLTTLPAGTSALVLEKNKAVYKSGMDFDIVDFSSGYFSSTSLMEESLEISAVDGKITVKNIGTGTYSKLYVYYKLRKLDGTYMGGITYRTPVENLKPGDVQEVVAAHYREASSHIIMVEAAVE